MSNSICSCNKCKVCGSSNLRKDEMIEEGEALAVTICNSCGWWG